MSPILSLALSANENLTPHLTVHHTPTSVKEVTSVICTYDITIRPGVKFSFADEIEDPDSDSLLCLFNLMSTVLQKT